MRVCAVVSCENVGRFTFPTNELLRSQWIRATRVDVQRKIGWTLRRYSSLCPKHFKPSDFVTGSTTKYGRLKKNVVPSIFPWSTPPIIVEQPTITVSLPKSVASQPEPYLHFDRSGAQKKYGRSVLPIVYVGGIPISETSIKKEVQDPLQISDGNGSSINFSQLSSPRFVDVHIDTKEVQDVKTEIIDLKINRSVQTDPSPDCNHSNPFSIHKYKHSDKAIHFFTGLKTFEKLMFVLNTLGDCSNLKYIYETPPKRMDVLEQFYITLLILRRHKEFEDIAMLYLISVKQVTNIFVTWVRFMSLQWKNLDLLLDQESDESPMTKVVIDASECHVKKLCLPLAQQATFSNHKNRIRVKVLIGIAPSGLITYVSPYYADSATDRQIIKRSSILHRFNNKELSYKLNMPSIFKKGNEITPETLNKDSKVARVNVKRVIGMLKTYRILTQPMNSTETLVSSDIVFICAMLVNFRSNIDQIKMHKMY